MWDKFTIITRKLRDFSQPLQNDQIHHRDGAEWSNDDNIDYTTVVHHLPKKPCHLVLSQWKDASYWESWNNHVDWGLMSSSLNLFTWIPIRLIETEQSLEILALLIFVLFFNRLQLFKPIHLDMGKNNSRLPGRHVWRAGRVFRMQTTNTQLSAGVLEALVTRHQGTYEVYN